MASLHRKYQDRIEVGPRQEAPPVSAPPRAAELPEPAANAGKPPPEVETESPAEKAGKDALRQRLAEMERAETLTRQAQQPPPRAAEPQEPQELPSLEDQIAHLPERVQGWYRKHPELAMDPERAAQVQYCHHVARRETGEDMTPVYYDRMEQMLGLRQQPPVGAEGRPQSNGNGQVESRPSAPPRNEAPPDHSRGQAPRRAMAAPVSAPPTREVPSMTTGRAPRHRAPLTADELQIAQQCGQTPEEYQQQKEKMQHLKQIGAIQDGR
jgi:hypothetical protein